MDLYNLGENLYLEGKYEEALECFRQCFETEEDKASALNYLGCCCLCLERFKEALKAFDEALELKLWERPLLNKGRVFLAQGNYSEALACFNRALMVNPEEGDIYFYLGVYNDRLGDYEASRSYYEKAITYDYNDPEYHLNLSVACFRTDYETRALEEVNISISLDGSVSNCKAYFNKGYILYIIHKFQEALDTFLTAVDMLPGDTETMNMIANCYYRLKQYENCRQWLHEVLRIDPVNEEANSHWEVVETIR